MLNHKTGARPSRSADRNVEWPGENVTSNQGTLKTVQRCTGFGPVSASRLFANNLWLNAVCRRRWSHNHCHLGPLQPLSNPGGHQSSSPHGLPLKRQDWCKSRVQFQSRLKRPCIRTRFCSSTPAHTPNSSHMFTLSCFAASAVTCAKELVSMQPFKTSKCPLCRQQINGFRACEESCLQPQEQQQHQQQQHGHQQHEQQQQQQQHSGVSWTITA